jgi:hypothetical protein
MGELSRLNLGLYQLARINGVYLDIDLERNLRHRRLASYHDLETPPGRRNQTAASLTS